MRTLAADTAAMIGVWLARIAKRQLALRARRYRLAGGVATQRSPTHCRLYIGVETETLINACRQDTVSPAKPCLGRRA